MSNGSINGYRNVVVKFAGNHILELKSKPGVLFWTCALAVDADGHPQAYHPKGSPPGLDYLANAGSPGHWWGLACTSGGVPYVQKDTDPAPGFYVSTTSLEDPSKEVSNPARYTNSGTVPFIVLPLSPKFSPIQRLGDVAVVFNDRTGKCSWAVYADGGPNNQIGEGSMALAEALGINSDPKKGGTNVESIGMVYWPGSRITWPATSDELSIMAWSLFSQWGGFDSAKVAMPQFNWDQFHMPVPITPTPLPAPPAPPPSQPTEDTIVTITVDAPPGVKVKVVGNV